MMPKFPTAGLFCLFTALLSWPGWLVAQSQSPPQGFAADAPRVLVTASRETTLVARSNSQIRQIKSGLGAWFRKGEALIRFDCAQQSARREIALATVSAAARGLEAKKKLNALRAAGELEVAVARSALDKAQAELALSNVFVSQCTVNAPYDGRLVKQHVRRYQGVRAGDPLLEIVGSTGLKLRLNVPSTWLSWLKRGAIFEVRIDETSQVYPAKVTGINARVDAVSQSVAIEGRVNGKTGKLLAGMSGVARFAARR